MERIRLVPICLRKGISATKSEHLARCVHSLLPGNDVKSDGFGEDVPNEEAGMKKQHFGGSSISWIRFANFALIRGFCR